VRPCNRHHPNRGISTNSGEMGWCALYIELFGEFGVIPFSTAPGAKVIEATIYGNQLGVNRNGGFLG